MLVVGRVLEYGVFGFFGGCVIGKLIGGIGGWEFIGLRFGGFIGSRGISRGVLGREVELGCMMFGGVIGGGGFGRGYVLGNFMGLRFCVF